MENVLIGCSPLNEFQIRNCLKEAETCNGALVLSDLLVHHYTHPAEKLPISVLMQLEQCHNSDRLAVTQ